MTKQTLSDGRLGGSMIGAVLGDNPYVTAYQLWRRMTGRSDPKDRPSNRYIEWGNRLEAAIRQKYADDHGVTVTVPGQSIDHANGWARATPDGIIDGSHGLEIKAARSGDRWGPKTYPKEYEWQCRFYMWICDLPRWDLAVLIGGNDYREYVIERDSSKETTMIQAGQRFMTYHVAFDVPPEPVIRETTRIDRLIAQLKSVRQSTQELTLVEQQLERELGDAIEGDAQMMAILQEL